MKRSLYAEDHERFRVSFRAFLRAEVVPHQLRWLEAGVVDREVWRKAGAAGFLCPTLPRAFGGHDRDFLCACVINEELASIYETGFGIRLHSDTAVPLLHANADDEQRRRWLPRCSSGDLIVAIALTELEGGSDLAGLSTLAVRDGDHYVLDGVKTFISNGMMCDLCIVAAKTSSGAERALGRLSLFVVESATPGLRRRALKKIGMHSQDTAELTFDGCQVPATNRLGEEGSGMVMLLRNLVQERLVEAVNMQATAEQVMRDTVTHVRGRRAFGQPLGSFQHTQFKLAECAAKVEVGRAFIDRLIEAHARRASLAVDTSIAKLWTSQMLTETVDACVQLHGGAGYLMENPVARAYVDTRARRIAGGSDEILKLIIARDLRLEPASEGKP